MYTGSGAKESVAVDDPTTSGGFETINPGNPGGTGEGLVLVRVGSSLHPRMSHTINVAAQRSAEAGAFDPRFIPNSLE
jgi:hypothetical protein